MKHVLYGTTALVAAGLFAGAPQVAYADVELELGGRYMGAAGAVFSEDFGENVVDEDNFRNHIFVQDVEVYFSGETVLDNGLTIGARVELEAERRVASGGHSYIDAVYAYASGGFGEARFGNFNEAGVNLCYLVPSAGYMFGADSPIFSFSAAGTNATCPGLESAASGGQDKATKIMYTSPTFGPLHFAVSYTPENLEGDFVSRFDNNDSQLEDVISVAATFAHDFNGFNVVVGGSGAWADYEVDVPEGDDPSWYNAYVNLSFSGFTFGGAFGYTSNYVDYAQIDKWVYGAGVTYNFEEWTVGLGWTHGEYEQADFGGADNTNEKDIIQLTGSYALGPGIAIDAMVGYNDFEDDELTDNGTSTTVSDGDYDAFEVALGLRVGF